jgi:transcriptional regulator with XRE-family HTH domain
VVVLDAAKIRAALNRKGLTQREAAERAGVSQTTMVRIVNGLAVRRHKAALVIAMLEATPDLPGVEAYLPTCPA